MWRQAAAIGLIGLLLASCALTADIVPKDGPTGEAVRKDAEVYVQAPGEPLSYAFVQLSPPTVNLVNRATEASVPRFHNLPAWSPSKGEIGLAAGDVISLTVFEARAGGLFIPAEASVRPGNFVQMAAQQIDGQGQINVPYAGNVSIAGMTTSEAAALISRRLASRAIEPQTVISVVERRSHDLSVLGEVTTPVRFFMDPGGIRLLAAIARAGGPKQPAYESIVTLQRKGVTQQALLSAVVKDPSQNIQLAPGDSVFVSREPKAFLAFGATSDTSGANGGVSRRFLFDTDNYSLAEGIARAGGLDQTRADPKAVFVLRFEKRSVLSTLGVDVSIYPQDLVPTVYSVDLSRPEGFFMMNNFYLRHLDMVVVADKPLTDIQKLLVVLQTASTIMSNVGTARYNLEYPLTVSGSSSTSLTGH